MGGNNNWYPGAFAVILILVLGFVFPLISAGFVEPDSIQTTGLMNDTIDYINNGFNVTINLPIFPDISGTLPSVVPAGMREPLTSRLTYLSLIPSVILIPLLILCILGIIWTLIAIVKPGSS